MKPSTLRLLCAGVAALVMVGCVGDPGSPLGPSGTTTNTGTTTTSQSFATGVYPANSAPNMLNTCQAACHAGFPVSDPRRFTNQTEAFNFALARTAPTDPTNLMLRKTDGTVAHGGGIPWPNPSSARTAVDGWINAGRQP